MNFHGYKLQHLDNNWRLGLETVKAQRFLRLHMARFGVSLTKLGECKKLVTLVIEIPVGSWHRIVFSKGCWDRYRAGSL